MGVTTSLEGKTAVVTGVGRKKGIGAAICKELAKAGANIVFTYWNRYDESMFEELEKNEPMQIYEEIRQLGVQCDCIELDLSRDGELSRLLPFVNQHVGEPDILVNNACYSKNDHFETLAADELDKHYLVNVRATVLMSVQFARTFKKKSGGRIINLTSGQSLGPMPGEISYATTKGAIDAFTKTFAAEVAAKGITVNAVNPGPTDTGWMNSAIKEQLLKQFPMGRVGMPEDAARLIKFLASDEAEWITGQILHSEGGFMRG